MNRASTLGGDELTVTGEIGKGQGLIIQHLQEATWATTVLHVGPTGFGYGGHVEAALPGDEIGFVVTEPLV